MSEKVHYQQPGPYGCMAYAFASLTGNESMIEHAEDCCTLRFEIRANDLGFMFRRFYYSDYATCDRSFWDHFIREYSEWGGYFSLMLCIPSLVYAEANHAVGAVMRIEHDQVVILDPSKPGPEELTIAQFLDGPYSKCYEVANVQTNSLDRYKPIHGPSANLIPIEAPND